MVCIDLCYLISLCSGLQHGRNLSLGSLPEPAQDARRLVRVGRGHGRGVRRRLERRARQTLSQLRVRRGETAMIQTRSSACRQPVNKQLSN